MSIWSMHLILFFLGSIVFSDFARAEAPPIVTWTEGTVELFSDPSQNIHTSVPEGAVRARYEGMNYLATPVKPGMTLPMGAWLRTRPGAKARVIFENGDQMNVGSATLMKIEPPKKGALDSGSMELRFGVVRSVISKTGPRNRFKVRTASAVMGVRGTDFVVESRGGTSLTLIRGAVSMQSGVSEKKASEKVVRTGETAWSQKQVPIEVYSTSKTEFLRVLESTEIQKAASIRGVSTELSELESRAREVTRKDLMDQASSPEERSRLEKLVESGASAEVLNRAAIQARIESAPEKSPGLERLRSEARKRSKATGSQLEDLEKDPYGKYFEKTQSE